MRVQFAYAIAAAVAASVPGAASATVQIVFDDRDGGAANFDATVLGANGVVSTKALGAFTRASSVDFGDFTITRNNGGQVSHSGVYRAGGESTTSNVIAINPSGGRGEAAKGSGITFTFDEAINSIGFEVGDWATCCAPSNLYISFDDGAPILVGESKRPGDQYLTNGQPIVFVAAFDDSGGFTKVQFWGDGTGESLFAGGTVRYALLDPGTLPGGVPEPATWAMMIGGFGLVGAAMRRRAAGLALA